MIELPVGIALLAAMLAAIMVLSFLLIQDICKNLPALGSALGELIKGLAQDDEKSTKVDVNRQAEFDISYELDKNNFNWYNI